MQRREFLRLLALASAAGATLRPGASNAQAANELYELPPFGNVSLLHVTDVHAQLKSDERSARCKHIPFMDHDQYNQFLY